MLNKIITNTLKKIVPRAMKDFKEKLETNFMDSETDDDDPIKEPGYSGL